MEYILRVYSGARIDEIALAAGESCTAGSGIKDRLRLDARMWKKSALAVTVTSGGWQLGKKHTPVMPFGHIEVADAERRLAATVFTNRAPVRVEQFPEDMRVTVGRSAACAIVLDDALVSERHLTLEKHAGEWRFADCGSRNGTYLNGTACSGAPLENGATLTLGFTRLTVVGGTLEIRCPGAVRQQLQPASPARTAAHASDPYPYLFKPSPRLIEQTPTDEIELQAPPVLGAKPTISWLNVLLAPVLTVAVMLVVCLVLTGVTTMLYFSVPMTCIGAVMSVLRYRGEKKKFAGTEQLRLEKYGAYLQEQTLALQRLADTQRQALMHDAPSCAACVRLAEQTGRTIWDRRLADADFMCLRVGAGTLPATFSIRAPRQLLTLQTDLLAEQPAQLLARYEQVDDCPVCVDLGAHGSCGLIGQRSRCVTAAKNLIVQAAAHHSYEDLRIVVLFPEEETAQWAFCRWLPHCQDGAGGGRLLAAAPKQGQKLLHTLDDVLSARRTEAGRAEYGAARRPRPFYLFVCADPALARAQTLMRELCAGDPASGAAALFLFDTIAALPEDCCDILDFTGPSNLLYTRAQASKKQKFTLDPMTDAQYDVFARALAPLRVEPVEANQSLPQTVSFLQGYHAATAQALPFAANWAKAAPERGMAVPIGVRADGSAFVFDIHEKRHGPHGLVAGMTGSGKSEMVQSWILSMAVQFPPEAVSFVLIDFKGTGLILPFKSLPHLAGSISDLDTSIGRNLVALQNELTRRKSLFDRAGVKNISEYLSLLREGKVSEPLSYLFIVIDEFAEFKNRFPEFMQAVNSVFAIGRALGVHMLLLTQKPGSVIDDKMNANTRFRWCLKVANTADSREMLKHNDAARITNPGRAYVQVGEDEVYEQIQSYWSGAPYCPGRDVSRSRGEQVAVVDLCGARLYREAEQPAGYRSQVQEIDAVVEALADYCQSAGIAAARKLWTPRLPEKLPLGRVIQPAFDGERWQSGDGALRVPVGLVDDPGKQAQYPLCLDFTAEGHCAVYGAPGTGKTTLLQTAVMSLALTYTPAQAQVYLMDFGGGSLRLFAALPHVGGVAAADDAPRMEKLAAMLGKELARRKKLLAEHGLVNVSSYREATGEALPDIVLVLDNFAPVLELYPKLEGFFQTFVQGGGSCGMYLLVSAGTQNALSFRVSQHIKAALCLRMTDKSDYAPIVGATNGLVPENHPGRGLRRGQPPLEFQTALPATAQSELERVRQIRRLAAQMDRAWDGARPPRIPVLPDVVREQDYPTSELLCGLEVETVRPVTVDMKKTQYLLLSCAQDGAAGAQALMRQLRRKLAPAICVEFAGEPGQAAAFDEAIAALMPELQKRKMALRGARLDEGQWPFILVQLTDAERCVHAVSNETLRRLLSIVTLGRGLNVLLVVQDSAEALARLYNSGESMTMRLVESGVSLLLGGNAQQHMAVRTDLAYTAAAANVEKGEGYVVEKGHALRIRAAVQ